jgi:hypothetical protein
VRAGSWISYRANLSKIHKRLPLSLLRTSSQARDPQQNLERSGKEFGAFFNILSIKPLPEFGMLLWRQLLDRLSYFG